MTLEKIINFIKTVTLKVEIFEVLTFTNFLNFDCFFKN